LDRPTGGENSQQEWGKITRLGKVQSALPIHVVILNQLIAGHGVIEVQGLKVAFFSPAQSDAMGKQLLLIIFVNSSNFRGGCGVGFRTVVQRC